MKLESVRSLKAELSDEVVAARVAEGGEALRAFHASTEPPMPEGVALGVSRRTDGEHVLAVRTADAAAAQALVARAKGEADVRVLSVAKRSTPAYLQGLVRPLEPGLQVAMARKSFVGTLGCFVRDDHALYMLSNSHVLADEGQAQPGHEIGQPSPSALVGVLERFVPFHRDAPNRVDAAIARVDRRLPVLTGWSSALNSGIRGLREIRAEDLGEGVCKVGRTTGRRQGVITAVEIDGLPVAYDVGTLRFNDQVEISGGPATDFSAPGDSGSLITDLDGWAIALLFAGGRDATGEDFTYANRLVDALSSLGVRLA